MTDRSETTHQEFGDAADDRGTFADYVALMRLDHSPKHILIAPGFVLAYLLRGVRTDFLLGHITLGILTAISIASANYVINEWFDREFDKYHPTKAQRLAVKRQLRGLIVWSEWITLLVIGLTCSWLSSISMLVVASIFALQGAAYNVPPLRTKDTHYLDVISESINNPLRLILGWAMVDPSTLPPGSIILCYWFGGAFLMAAKRFSEFRELGTSQGIEVLIRYRASFASYSDVSLTVCCFVCGLLSSFFLAVFLIKYRVEYLLLMPLIVVLFAYYLALAMQPGSSAQRPEKLFRERLLVLLILLIVALFVATTVIDVPMLKQLTEQRYISI